MLLVTHARGSTYQGYEAPNANNDLVMHTAHEYVASTGYLIEIGAKVRGKIGISDSYGQKGNFISVCAETDCKSWLLRKKGIYSNTQEIECSCFKIQIYAVKLRGMIDA